MTSPQFRSALSPLNKFEIDEIFAEADLAFEEHQRGGIIVNESCKPKIFKPTHPPFKLNTAKYEKAISDGIEVEARYGYFQNNRFIPGVPKEAFYNLLKSLNAQIPGIQAKESIDYIVKEGKESVRIVQSEGKYDIHSKERLFHYDIKDWGFRIAASRENPFKNPEKEMDKYGDDMAGKIVRRKVRYTFPMAGRQWDLTIVSDPKNPSKPPIFEVEIEYTVTSSSFAARIEKDFKNGLQLLYKTSKENMLCMRDLDILMNNHNNLFDYCNSKKMSGRFYEIENKPQGFKFSNIYTGSKYHVTPKLDGLRRRIFVDVNGIFIINPGTRYASQIAGPYCHTQETAIADTIIDTEYYEPTDKYFPFDVLIFDGESYLNSPFSERISKARAINLDMFDFSKPFFGESDFFTNFKNCLQWQAERPNMAFDGQIAQIDKPPYKSFNTMKIKPLHELTVDLLTEIDSKGRVTFKSYTSIKNHDIKLGDDPRGMKIEKFGNEDVEWKDVRGKGPTSPKSGFIAEYNLLEDFPFLKFKNFRHDKVKPNFSGVVDSVRRSFYDDRITENDLLGETLMAWRKWASANKRAEIEQFIEKGSTILDIGVGRGGTLMTAAKKARRVFGIDPDRGNLEELWDRIDTAVDDPTSGWDEHLKNRVSTAVLRGQQTKKIMEFIGDPVDSILSMYSISFFFENEVQFDKLIQTFDQCGTRDATVLINFMDGGRVGELLQNGTINTELYKIKVGHKNSKNKTLEENTFGNPISITFKKETNSIFKYQEEYLAYYELIKKKMAQIGYIPVKDSFLNIGATLPNSNNEFAKFNRSVVFKRIVPKGRKIVEYKAKEEVNDWDELPQGKNKKLTIGNTQYTRHGVKWDKSSFLRSVIYHVGDQSVMEDEVEDLRDNLTQMLEDDKTEYKKLKKGNVEKRMTYDKLYTKSGKKIIFDPKVALNAGYVEYIDRVRSGAVGHELLSLISQLYDDKKITVINEDGKVIGSNGDGDEVFVLKISNYAYAPLSKDSKPVKTSTAKSNTKSTFKRGEIDDDDVEYSDYSSGKGKRGKAKK